MSMSQVTFQSFPQKWLSVTEGIQPTRWTLAKAENCKCQLLRTAAAMAQVAFQAPHNSKEQSNTSELPRTADSGAKN